MAHNRAEIVKTEAELGGVNYRLYVHDKHTGRVVSVAVLQLTESDLHHALNLIQEARWEHAERAQTSLPF